MAATTSDPAAETRLIDVPIPTDRIPRDFVLGTLIAIFVLFVLGLIASAFAFPTGPVLQVTAIVLAAAAVGAVFIVLVMRALRHESRIRAARRQLESADPAQPPPIEPLQEFVRSERDQPRLGLIARTLARRGFHGIALRYSRPDVPSPAISPLTIPFEPLSLYEVDAAFRGVAIDAADIKECDERSETLRRLRRGWRMGGFGFGIVAVVQIGTQVYRAWLARTLTFEIVIWIAMLGLAFLVLLLPLAPRGPAWIVPGGIIHRRTRWFSAKSRAHLYTPATGVLIVYPTAGQKWSWAVADEKRSHTGVGTELEIRTLLRAWLSPLPPPTPEMLCGLAGE